MQVHWPFWTDKVMISCFFFFFFFFFFFSVPRRPIPLSTRSAGLLFQQTGFVGFPLFNFRHCLTMIYISCLFFLSLSQTFWALHDWNNIYEWTDLVFAVLCLIIIFFFFDAMLSQDTAYRLLLSASRCQLQVASNFDYRRAQSALRSTDDINLILVCHILSILLCLSFFPEMHDITWIFYTQVTC